MLCAVPVLRDRVAPRCSFADGLMLVTVSRGHRVRNERLQVSISSPFDLLSHIKSCAADTIICGGINSSLRETLMADGIDIVDNVACSIDQLLIAMDSGLLRPGYSVAVSTAESDSGNTGGAHTAGNDETSAGDRESPMEIGKIDCIECTNRVCIRGENCLDDIITKPDELGVEDRKILEVSMDIALEKSRRLCRLAELVYYGLEMNYRKVGIAFCVDMWEPTEILTDVLKRFFEVTTVCCKVGGISESDMVPGTSAWTDEDKAQVSCNPVGQASVLNRTGTDMNIIVGLCVGADCLFTMESRAPVTTLFVKDKSLANNPIGALYSEYYLRESVASAAGRVQMQNRSGPLRGRLSGMPDSNNEKTGENKP